MAKLNIPHPTNLLGRHVYGSYRCGHYVFPFDGVVECVVVPAPGETKHQVEFYVSGEYVSLRDCINLQYRMHS